MSVSKNRWTIKGTLMVVTPLSLGSGLDDLKRVSDEEGRESRLRLVQVDHKGQPCLPGSSLKGVLRHAAQQLLPPTQFQALFGSAGASTKDTHAGGVYFCAAYLSAGAGSNFVGEVTSHARDRKTKAVANKKLFSQEVVHPGAVFDWTLTTGKEFDEKNIQALLGLLNLFNGKTSGLTLGASSAGGLGCLLWQLDEVSANPIFSDWLTNDAQPSKRSLKAQDFQSRFGNEGVLEVPVSLHFASPFLSASAEKKKAGQKDEQGKPSPDFVPLRGADGKARYPGRSLHGALRAQAERIANTLGIECDEAKDNPITRIFGRIGWRSVLRCGEFRQAQGYLHRQEFVGIDRFTGGASDGAKFSGESIVQAQFEGLIALDINRLCKKDAAWSEDAKVGVALLAHALKDLDQGDIPLGYGAAAKGYGQIDEQKTQVLGALQNVWRNHSGLPSLADCQAALVHRLNEALMASRFVQLSAAEAQTGHLPVMPSEFSKPSGADFHNPYQFLPLKAPSTEQWMPMQAFANRVDSHHWHDLYASKDAQGNPVVSGRITCELKTITPTFVGAQQTTFQDKTIPTSVAPFTLGESLAIPSTSLRGMIGNVLEASTGSALRVLADHALSTRRLIHDKPLSAIGRIVEVDGTLKLEPLTLPTLEVNLQRGTAEIPKRFRTMFPDSVKGGPANPLKALFGDWKDRAQAETLKSLKTGTAGSDTHVVPYPSTLRIKDGQLELGKLVDDKGRSDVLHIKVPNKGPAYLLGLRTPRTCAPVLSSTWAQRRSEPALAAWAKDKAVVRGYLRIMQTALGDDGRDLPGTRTHELFVPTKYFSGTNAEGKPTLSAAPKTFDSSKVTNAELIDYFKNRTFSILDTAVERFNFLADQQTESQEKKEIALDKVLPYHPKGTQRLSSDDTGNRKLRLKPGDLVFFDATDDGASVNELAFSSIWRSRVENKQGEAVTVHDFFRMLGTSKPVGQELLPMNDQREKVSPAEMMLGFVRGGEAKTINAKIASPNVLAMASKIRFSFGHSPKAQGPALEALVRLPILGGPKLPSPGMYFERTSSGVINKPEFATKANEFKPRGRKAYLHALQVPSQEGLTGVAKLSSAGEASDAGSLPWVSRTAKSDKNNNQRVSITPIKAGETFKFHIDFDNLNTVELADLCFSLRPFDSFVHRLGLGKSLGLGSVQITPISIEYVDRMIRYTVLDAFEKTNDRYHAQWGGDVSSIPAEHPFSLDSLTKLGAQRLVNRDPDLYASLYLLGNPRAVTLPVHVPQIQGKEIEGENFAWYVDNEADDRNHEGPHQILGALSRASKTLTGLSRKPRKKAA